MNKKDKLKKFLNKLEELDKSSEQFPIDDVMNMSENFISDEINNLNSKLKENVIIKSLDRINTKISKLKEDFDVKPIIELVKSFEADMEESNKAIQDKFQNDVTEIRDTLKKIKEESDSNTDSKISPLVKKLIELQKELSNASESHSELQESFTDITSVFEVDLDSLESDVKSLSKTYKEHGNKITALTEKDTEIEKKLEKIEADFLSRIVTLQQNRGGSANRKITVGSTDPLTRYTDINFIAGSNVTITTANDNTNKRVNFTIASDSSSNVKIESIGITIDGGGSAITTGSKGQITIPYAGTISAWYLVNKTATAGESGSIVVDVKRSGTSIVGSGNKPTITTSTGASASVSGWTSTAVTADDVLEFNVDSITTFTWINLVIKIIKT